MPKPTVNLMHRQLWSDPSAPWKEEHLQAAIVIRLRQAGIAFEVGMEGVRLSKSQRGKAKVQGMDAGRCDLKILLQGGITVHIELKGKGGRVSPEQEVWHDRLRSMGFEVHVIKASCPQAAVDAVADVLKAHGVTLCP